MIFMSEKQKRIDKLYSKVKDLEEGKKVLERAMHYNYYDKEVYSKLYNKLKILIAQIKEVKAEIAREKSIDEEQR